MADNLADLCSATDAFEIVVDGTRKMKLEYCVDETLQNKLRNIKYYENVFSWDMKNASKNSENVIIEFKTIDEVRKSFQKQLEMETYENGMELFNLHKYSIKLILCYELFINNQHNESLLEVEDLIKYMANITFGSHEHYIAAYNHMMYSTYAFISISMNVNNSCDKIMKDIKLQSELNDTEKSVIHAVKALVFMRYPSLSKHITFHEAEKACKLNTSETEFMHIWLLAKGPLNREFYNFEVPNNKELKMAEHLLCMSKSFWHLIAVSDVFIKVSKHTNDKQEKNKYFELASKNMLMAIELAGNNEHYIIKCLKIAINHPKLLLSKSIIEEKIQMLLTFKHPHKYFIIGNYYFKHVKDFQKAKDYFFLGKETDHLCVLKLLKIECILKPLDKIPIVESLKDAYHLFSNSISRIKFLSQILLYYTYYEEKQEKILHYFKLYMDQPFDNAFKYRHLISVTPIFEVQNFQNNEFLENLSKNVENIIKNHKCNTDEKIILNNTFQRFSIMVTEASNNTYLNQLGLDHLNPNVAKLTDIINNYESIFSWKIKQLTGPNRNLMINIIDKMREKLARVSVEDDNFSEYRLIISYELYTSGNLHDSLMETENIIRYLQSCKFNEINKHYLPAYNHIIQATHGFISITLNLDFKMENIKPANSLNQVERAAICAFKARIFLEYSPKGNDIALTFAEQACKLNSTEYEYIAIWLKAKGRVRRHYHQYSIPDTDELNAVKLFCSSNTPSLLIQASSIYSEAAYYCRYKEMLEKSNNYYQLSSDTVLRAIELAKDDIEHLSFCLLVYVECPIEFQSKTIMDDLIKKLSNVKDDSCLNQALGIYYYKQRKDYEKAKIYLARGMAGGNFRCAMQLLKVECLLQPVDKFPIVKTLNMIYDNFPSPERRLIILSQILMFYYYYHGYDNTSIIHYLKLYLDQDVNDVMKKRYLINAYPNFSVGYFEQKTFFDILSSKVKNMKNYHNCSTEDKKILDRFDKLSKLIVYDNETDNHIQNNENVTSSNIRFPNKTSFNNRNNECSNWRKQPKCQQPSTNVDQNYGHGVNIANKLSWRNQRDRSQNQNEHVKEIMNWRLRQNNYSNHS